jgi:hypothetical protein
VKSDETRPSTGPGPAERVPGYDVARALALLGMIVVHFSLVAAADRSGPAWLAGVLALLDGRAAHPSGSSPASFATATWAKSG